MLLILLYLLVARGAVLDPPWSGPDMATVVLTVATLVLACVALLIAILGIWGYSTIHARITLLAEAAAKEKAEEVSRRFVRDILTQTLGVDARGGGESAMVEAFRREGGSK